jgi:hypothetical protein
MPMKDGFTPDDPLPLFVSEHADEYEQQGIGEVWDRAVISPRVLTAGILVATAAAIGITILLSGNPVTLFADVTASLVDKSPVDKSAPRPDTDQPTPTVQSAAAQAATQSAAIQSTAEASPPATKDASTRDEIAAAPEPAGQSPTETGQSQADSGEQSHEVLFKQFQAWAAEKDARAQAEPVQPVQGAPVQVAQNDDRAPVRHVQKHRSVQPIRDARAETRHVQKPRPKVRREQNAQVPVQPGQDPRAQDQSAQNAQNAQAPSFLQSFGLRN